MANGIEKDLMGSAPSGTKPTSYKLKVYITSHAMMKSEQTLNNKSEQLPAKQLVNACLGVQKQNQENTTEPCCVDCMTAQ